ncbi:MAG TPA: sulfatase-like hydrolase/transferase [Thermoanaerobaculia bacterium]|nr:sulfatase-like hydrolase/transferase [Thermoanaerobaculia bacterium]
MKALARLTVLIAIVCCACTRESARSGEAPPASRPSILLVTLDTTRADVVAPEGSAELTPNLARLAQRATRFSQAYATAPMTLPSHTSMLTGLYPSAHGIHENSRAVGESQPLVAAELRAAGYSTAAFVSVFVLDRQFGLARGFDEYDDRFAGGAAERWAGATTDRALAWLAKAPAGPLFMWVHYWDAHAPYTPPEPFATRYASSLYRGEVAYVDSQLGRLLAAFEARANTGGWRVLVVGDHGEGLGEHGEAQHGNLLYQATMRVPLMLAGSGIPASVVATPVSTRRVHDTLLAWAGLPAPRSLLAAADEPVLGEAMKPFLDYGWQSQVMAVEGRLKVIRSGETEVYDVIADPAEAHDLAGSASPARASREALRAYPVPTPSRADQGLPAETRQRLASLGYVASSGTPRLRADAPSPRRMAHLFPYFDLASGLFTQGEYTNASIAYEHIVHEDPHNPMATMYLAVAHSMLGDDAEAMRWFRRAAELQPDSIDLRHYEAMHYCKNERWEKAEPLLQSVLAAEPDRLPALDCLADIRAHQGRREEAIALLDRVVAKSGAPFTELLRLGELHMQGGETAPAIAAYERARALDPGAFTEDLADLQLGVLYLAARRLPEARDSLDRALARVPKDSMALFKRAQVSVLLGEPDRAARVQRARDGADEETRPLIDHESLFRGL